MCSVDELRSLSSTVLGSRIYDAICGTAQSTILTFVHLDDIGLMLHRILKPYCSETMADDLLTQAVYHTELIFVVPSCMNRARFSQVLDIVIAKWFEALDVDEKSGLNADVLYTSLREACGKRVRPFKSTIRKSFQKMLALLDKGKDQGLSADDVKLLVAALCTGDVQAEDIVSKCALRLMFML